ALTYLELPLAPELPVPVPAPALEPLPEPPGLAWLLEEPMLPDGEEGADEPPAALPLRLPCWLALEPAPALSARWQAVMPTASTAAVSAAVMALRFISSPLGRNHTYRGAIEMPKKGS